MPTARVDIILYIADRNDSRQISLLMNTCCEFFSWPKFLMSKIRGGDGTTIRFEGQPGHFPLCMMLIV